MSAPSTNECNPPMNPHPTTPMRSRHRPPPSGRATSAPAAPPRRRSARTRSTLRSSAPRCERDVSDPLGLDSSSRSSAPCTASADSSCCTDTPRRRIPSAMSIGVNSSVVARDVGGEVRRLGKCPRARDRPEVGEAHLELHRATDVLRLPQSSGDPVGEAHELALERRAVGDVARERLLVPDRLHLAHRFDGALISVPRERVKVLSVCDADRADERVLGHRREVADGPHTEALEPPTRRGPDPPEPLDRQWVQERELLTGRDDDQPIGLREIARDLGQELRRRDADRRVQPGLRLHSGADSHCDLGARAVQPVRAANVEERLVERERLHQWRERAEDRHDVAARGFVCVEARREEHRVRARPTGPRHRHRRVDPERAPRSWRRRRPRAGRAHRRRPGDPRAWDPRAARPTRRRRRGRRAGCRAGLQPRSRLAAVHRQRLVMRAVHGVAVTPRRSAPIARRATRRAARGPIARRPRAAPGTRRARRTRPRPRSRRDRRRAARPRTRPRGRSRRGASSRGRPRRTPRRRAVLPSA